MKHFALLLLLLSGCFANEPSTIDIKYPVIQVPDRPPLNAIGVTELQPLPDDVIRKLVANDNDLKTYIEKLEAAIEAYNRWAKENSK